MYIVVGDVIGYYMGVGWSAKGIGSIALFNSKKEAKKVVEIQEKIYPNCNIRVREIIGVKLSEE